MQTLIYKDFVIPQRDISRKKISTFDRIKRGERFTAYLDRFFSGSPALIVKYKPTLYHYNFTEREICGFKRGGYGSERKGFLSDEKALDFIGLVKAKFPETPPPRFEYLVGADDFMTESDIKDYFQEIERKIEKHKRNIEALERQKEALKKRYLQERD